MRVLFMFYPFLQLHEHVERFFKLKDNTDVLHKTIEPIDRTFVCN